MSYIDVAEIFYPVYKMRSEYQEQRLATAQTCILGLRRRLRTLNPALPDEYDGPAWWPLEQAWKIAPDQEENS